MSATGAWMPLYIGDYLGDTAHLTTEQHGAYLLLLMHQWRRGFIPSDEVSLAQITRATINRWRTRIAPAVMVFFSLREGGLVQARLAVEIEKAKKNSEKSSQSAAARWNKNKQPQSNEIKAQADANASPEHMRIACPSPSPSPSEKKERDSAIAESYGREPANTDSAPVSQPAKPATKRPPKTASKHPLPADWQPCAEERAYAAERGLDPDRVALDFRDYWTAKAEARAGWTGTWQTWCRREADRPRPSNVTHLRPKSHSERVRDRYAFAAAPIEDVFGDLWGSRSDEFRGPTVDVDPIAAEG